MDSGSQDSGLETQEPPEQNSSSTPPSSINFLVDHARQIGLVPRSMVEVSSEEINDDVFEGMWQNDVKVNRKRLRVPLDLFPEVSTAESSEGEDLSFLDFPEHYQEASNAWLLQRQGSSDKSKYVLRPDSQMLLLGRDELATFKCQDIKISRRHLEFRQVRQEPSSWTVTDVGSKHGTYLNGIRLVPDEPKVLQHNDLLSIGSRDTPESVSGAINIFVFKVRQPLTWTQREQKKNRANGHSSSKTRKIRERSALARKAAGLQSSSDESGEDNDDVQRRDLDGLEASGSGQIQSGIGSNDGGQNQEKNSREIRAANKKVKTGSGRNRGRPKNIHEASTASEPESEVELEDLLYPELTLTEFASKSDGNEAGSRAPSRGRPATSDLNSDDAGFQDGSPSNDAHLQPPVDALSNEVDQVENQNIQPQLMITDQDDFLELHNKRHYHLAFCRPLFDFLFVSNNYTVDNVTTWDIRKFARAKDIDSWQSVWSAWSGHFKPILKAWQAGQLHVDHKVAVLDYIIDQDYRSKNEIDWADIENRFPAQNMNGIKVSVSVANKKDGSFRKNMLFLRNKYKKSSRFGKGEEAEIRERIVRIHRRCTNQS